MTSYDWNKISDSKLNKINKSKPIFILGSRDISSKRIEQITSLLTPKGNVLWGCLKDEYIPGLQDSAQFKSLTIEKLETSIPKEKIDTLQYFQRDIKYILKEITPKATILINGSWHRAMHLREEFWVIQEKKIPYKFLSPFVDEREAKEYCSKINDPVSFKKNKKYNDQELMSVVERVSKRSFDYTYQIGAVIAKEGRIILTAHNKILPYETYAMHHGALKEINFSPPQDLNHYDAIHAEVDAILLAQKNGISLKGTSLYINLLPCPTCAKMIANSDVKEIVYMHDHSQGYAYKLLQGTGKIVRRVL